MLQMYKKWETMQALQWKNIENIIVLSAAKSNTQNEKLKKYRKPIQNWATPSKKYLKKSLPLLKKAP